MEGFLDDSIESPSPIREALDLRLMNPVIGSMFMTEHYPRLLTQVMDIAEKDKWYRQRSKCRLFIGFLHREESSIVFGESDGESELFFYLTCKWEKWRDISIIFADLTSWKYNGSLSSGNF